MVASISPAQLAELRRTSGKVTLIDVRTPAEYGEVHVDFARNVPLDRLSPQDVAGLAAARAGFSPPKRSSMQAMMRARCGSAIR